MLSYKALIWPALVTAIVVPVVAATMSPLLQWRAPIYIAAGFAGIAALCLMVFQPLLAAAFLPGLSMQRSRVVHRAFGAALVLLVLAHVIGLWVTSPPDVIDALLFVSPTPFSVWGVTAMWCVFASAGLVAMRRRFLRIGLSIQWWRYSHRALAAVTVIGTVVHALKIEGAMETITKTGLCMLVVLLAALVLLNKRAAK